ncbi:uncharacterized protein V6R79_007822 [Siganus canaliculatus]
MDFGFAGFQVEDKLVSTQLQKEKEKKKKKKKEKKKKKNKKKLHGTIYETMTQRKNQKSHPKKGSYGH